MSRVVYTFIKPLCWVLLAASVAKTYPGKAQIPIFKSGDEVCFVGNSITNHGGFHHDIALFYATRYPSQKINIINSGVSGNRVINVLNRLDSDVLINQPNWSVIKLGMNDVMKDLYTAASSLKPGIIEERQKVLDIYRRDYEILIKALISHNSKIILQTPTIYDETAFIPANEKLPGRNGALKLCAEYVKEFAKKYNLPVVDYWTIMNEITRKIQAVDSTSTIVGADRVHPGPVGHFIMAHQFLKTTGVQKQVSKIMVNTGKLNNTQGSFDVEISGLKSSKSGVSFTCLENSLPFPLPQGVDAALKLVPFTEDLNKQTLIIEGLLSGTYQLKIDKNIIGVYSTQELSKGINLAQNKKTPQYAQSQKILHLFEDYWKLEATNRYIRGMEMGRLQAKKIYTLPAAQRYFDQAVSEADDTTTATYKDLVSFRNTYLPAKTKEPEMLAQMTTLHNLIYKENQPVPHHFEIIKQ